MPHSHIRAIASKELARAIIAQAVSDASNPAVPSTTREGAMSFLTDAVKSGPILEDNDSEPPPESKLSK
ncbi:MAG TPA: hypothetical protein DEV73_04140 [Candidatus Zambryskibacteria bacterium]|nr:MAG: hypothetical protein UT68_C0006G0054 [Parcubacteria group bacterium GW2011_GWC2_40_10]KKR64911.1 MAG: hypothetical protein UU06_C0035G0008 [Parcubacteria group bacterium GW2011_GWB1_40_5]KKR69060.1 MAG: hypothetical protein UU11_C0003G0054 [Parcubacteria group bacterium GW2011_GWF2_40_69]KKR81642.1 MAG: hypothetical protein UU27_C0012G0017 [Parcubacteria group bacterium GW2011_GWD1_40_9]HBD24809.1 hypothetical protein [Candidatus Zambryskibacteria bacterium]